MQPETFGPSEARERSGYRADIDGLRALAILPVVFYHAGIPGFAGGFVGVDVFFVISGYLMASLITGEMKRGEFSLLRFYERRVRRIFPALFVMIAACAVMAWFVFMPNEFIYFARSVRDAALFISNYRFEREIGYFDIAAETKPLLHTWSLAVEEQFYIVFPLVLMLLGWLAPRRTALVLLLVLVASLAASAWTVYQKPEAAFYLSQYRIWELLLGAMLAFNVVPKASHPLIREALAAAGVVLIAFAVFTYSDATVFPGLTALVPCVGAALIIHCQTSGGPASLLLRAPPLVFVGLVSYSMYLWHWPIVVFTRYFSGPELTLVQGGLITVASFVAAVISWRFVERPFRGHTSRIRRVPLFAGAAAAVTAASVFAAHVVADRGVPGRLPSFASQIYNATFDKSRFSEPQCFGGEGEGPSAANIRAGKLCPMGTPGSESRFLVWGDSHAASMAPAIDVAAKQAGVQGVFAGQAGCPPLPDVELPSRRITDHCRDLNAAVLDLIDARRIPVVFMIAYWPKYFHDSELPNQGIYFDPSVPPPVDDRSGPIVEAMDGVLANLKQRGIQVVLVMDVPEMGRFVPEALARAVMTGSSTDIAPPWSYTEKRQALARKILAAEAEKHGAAIVDPFPAFCKDGRCRATHDDGIPLYTDSDHLTATAARSLSYLYEPVLRELFPRPVAVD
ncbi:acyltransferase family protein [Mesorhizobium sp. IMUNJ 23232]|uniref:acyltransferase family protein n=1 Tax=Mesorhizobium sp. IMUNJ 23232 TaxID=3376064 RepID=UPI0037A378F0